MSGIDNFPSLKVFTAAAVAAAAVGYATYRILRPEPRDDLRPEQSSVLTTNLARDDQLQTLTLRHPSGSSVTIYKFGATLISWKLDNGKEMLFQSEKAVFDGVKPIRGGIPLVFPQFGGGKLPSHGFARRSMWRVHRVENNALVMTLTDTEETRKMWGNHSFRLLYTIVLGSRTLKTTLTVVNTQLDTFKFQALLHTYFKFPNLKNVRVAGLQGYEYKDKLSKSNKMINEASNNMQFTEETDRIYTGSPKKIVMTGTGGGVKSVNIQVSTYGQGSDNDLGNIYDIVVWNPHIAKSKRMDDFGDDEWTQMCCIEPGYVSKWNHLEGNGEWNLTQVITANLEE